MDKAFKDMLLTAMEDRDVKVPTLSIETGIPQDRIYKWLKPKGTSPKAKDTETLLNWINGKTSGIKSDTEQKYVTFNNEQYIESLKAQIKLMEAHNALLQKMYEEKFERLEAILNEMVKHGKIKQ